MGKITLAGRELEFDHKLSRRSRRLRLAIHPGGKIVITTPHKYDPRLLEKFIQDKSDWILAKYEQQKKIKPADPKISQNEYVRLKAQALVLAESRLNYFNKFYGYTYGKVSIKKHKTLWGSCSRRGNLNFNYKIALLPPDQADYIVVHELCHLKEFNHSARFWSLVAKTIPGHKRLRKELKSQGLSLN